MSEQHNIIIIAGLSGVGKTWAINQLKRVTDTFTHFSAGSLIKEGLGIANRDELRKLSSNEIIQNQYLLVEQLHEELKNIKEGGLVFLDAHMLIDSGEAVLEVPFEIFERIKPSKLIFLHEKPEIILNRRASDSSRKRPERTLEQLDEQQQRSIHNVKIYARELNIPYLLVPASDIKDMLVLVSS